MLGDILGRKECFHTVGYKQGAAFGAVHESGQHRRGNYLAARGPDGDNTMEETGR